MTEGEAAGPGSRKRAFRDRLIPGTIANAMKITFYRRHWRGVGAEGIASVDDLARLPLVDKATYLAREHEFDHPDYAGGPFFENHTSGTTTRSPMTRRRSRAEVEYISGFFASVSRTKALGVASAEGLPPLMVTTENSKRMHGDAIDAPLATRAVSVAFDGSAAVVDDLIDALADPSGRSGVHGDRVGILDAAAPELRQLTSRLLDRGIEPASLGVGTISVAGDYISPTSMRVLRGIWGGTRIINRYSMSEVFGGAALCDVCDAFHFDAFVHAEVVDIDTERPTLDGVGVLVMTELYPFVRSHPLIRYWNGDVVEARPPDRCPTGQFGFSYLGRAPVSGELGRDERRFTDWGGTQRFLTMEEEDGASPVLVTVLDGRATILVRSALVVDCLQSFEDVVCHALPDGHPPADNALGMPGWALTWHNVPGGRLIEVEVTVRTPDGARAADVVRQRLLRDNPELAAALASGAVALDVRAVVNRPARG